jgi:hypothetical protein
VASINRSSLLAALVFACWPAVVVAQTSVCRPADAESALVLAWVKGIVTGTDSASLRQRTAMQLPQVSASQVTYVTDATTCSKVLTPYAASIGFKAPATGPGEVPSGKLYVVKVGTVYVATDPALRAGDFRLIATVSKQYKLLWQGLG